MPDLVPEHAGQFRLVVHQRHQLPRDIDIAAGDRKGVVDRRVEQGDGEIAARVRQARLHGDILPDAPDIGSLRRSEEHTSELQSLMLISYAVFCLKKKRIQIYRKIKGMNVENKCHTK